MSPRHPCPPCQQYIELEAQILATKKHLIQILARQEELRVDINRCHDPVTRYFPPEIVFTIFEFFAQGYAEEDLDDVQQRETRKINRSPLVLGAVCRSWREISWSLPKLWTHLGILLRRPDDWNCLEITRKWLDRSRQLPLSLHLSIHQPEPLLAVDPREAFSRLISLINQQSSRWLNLRVCCSPVFFPLIRGDGHGTPILHSLSIELPRYIEQFHQTNFRISGVQTINFSIAGVKCRPIHFQCLNLGFCTFDIDWSQLTRARFTHYIGLEELIELLRQAPQLVECRILAVVDPVQTYQFPQSDIRIVHHNLQSLTFGHYKGTKLKLFFSIFLFPQLAHLDLADVLDSDLDCFIALATSS